MYDTVKFKIPVSSDLKEKIRKKSQEIKRYNHISNNLELNYFQTNITLPSYYRGVNIFHSDLYDDFVFIELSFPKFVYSHNLLMIDSEVMISSITRLYTILTHEYGIFTKPHFWEVIRLDLCYNWYLPNYESAKSLLGQLRTFNYPRKKKLNYESSIYTWAGHSTVKIYLKYDEFRANDFRALRKVDEAKAHELLHLSKNILRFEVELRKKQLVKEFDTKYLNPYTLFKDKNIINILNKYFNTFMNFRNTEIHSNLDIYRQLIKKSKSTTEANHLFQFYKLLHSPIEEDREFLKSTTHRTTIYRKKKKLREYGIGLQVEDTSLSNFHFAIPSNNNSNNYLMHVDGTVVPRHSYKSRL